jgi:pimeloyl-ACP methyl ester carboxylesterase
VKLAFDRGGEGDRLLVLLHGLGATRHVWLPFAGEARWRGTWIAPDLRGHGASPHAVAYGLGQHAADVGALIAASGTWRDIVVVGHSMGGVVALALASGWFGALPSRVFGIGVKVAWTDEELARLRTMAAQPAKSFASKDEAVARYLKTSGLVGLVRQDSVAAEAGVVADGGAWRLASDPKTMSVGAPPMRQLLAAAQAPVHLARGDGDAMVTNEQIRGYDPNGVDFAGLGHNTMVENPRAVWDWVEGRLA